MKNNLKAEEEKINNFFSSLAKILEDKKQELIENIRNQYKSNKDKIGSKLNFFGNKMESTDLLKDFFNDIVNSKNIEIFDGIDNFNKLLKVHSDQKNSFCKLVEFKFLHDDINNLNLFVGNFSEIKIRNKIVNFGNKNFQLPNSLSGANLIMDDDIRNRYNTVRNFAPGYSYPKKFEVPIDSPHYLKDSIKKYYIQHDAYKINSPKIIGDLELDLNKYKKSTKLKGLASLNSSEVIPHSKSKADIGLSKQNNISSSN